MELHTTTSSSCSTCIDLAARGAFRLAMRARAECYSVARGRHFGVGYSNSIRGSALEIVSAL